MNEKFIIKISFLCAVFGLLLVYGFSPELRYESRTLQQLNENNNSACEGFVKAQGLLVKTFYSQKGNFIGMLKENNNSAFVLLNENNFLFEGDLISVNAKASLYNKQCWLFPDSVELIADKIE